jgi:hypothetical protein
VTAVKDHDLLADRLGYGCQVMNAAQRALLDRLRELVEETPKSGALNAGRKPLYVNRFAQAVEQRSQDGSALVAYARAKVHAAPSSSYNSLVEAGRPDLTVEAVVADADAAWASEFSEEDRSAARARLGTMIEAHLKKQEAAEAEAVAHDHKIVAEVSALRLARGKPALRPDQATDMLKDRAHRRGGGK